jgi:glucosamine 6-phosphate synthetase-like amidotransferase/phosphosugar isomerase protein
MRLKKRGYVFNSNTDTEIVIATFGEVCKNSRVEMNKRLLTLDKFVTSSEYYERIKNDYLLD